MSGLLAALRPERYYESLIAIDVDDLSRLGLTGLIVDLDNTMVPRKGVDTTDELRTWLAKAKAAGLGVCVVSNNWHNRVGAVADGLGLPMVARATKPLARAFTAGMKALGTEPSDTAVIGDQMFTDVLGGNLLGLYTILVIPLSGPELFYTLALRRVERFLLRHWMRDDRLRLEPERAENPHRT
jgi:uncharacterized protein